MLSRILRIESGGTITLGHGEKFHARVKALELAADHCTHIIPSYNPVQSKGVDYNNKFLRWFVGGFRAFLLEYVYRGGQQLQTLQKTCANIIIQFTAAQVFPETGEYDIDESQVLRVGIGAKIVCLPLSRSEVSLSCRYTVMFKRGCISKDLCASCESCQYGENVYSVF